MTFVIEAVKLSLPMMDTTVISFERTDRQRSRVRCAWDRDHVAVLADCHDKCHLELATSASVAARPRPGESGRIE
jgi:hypothetical protein